MDSNPVIRALEFGFARGKRPSEKILRTEGLRAASTSDRRRLKREVLKKRASLVVRRGRHEERIPCLILDSSEGGLKIGGASGLKRGQTVEVILDGHSSNGLMCDVVWVGKPGSKQMGEVGLQIVTR